MLYIRLGFGNKIRLIIITEMEGQSFYITNIIIFLAILPSIIKYSNPYTLPTMVVQ